jgi:hypothetical protein
VRFFVFCGLFSNNLLSISFGLGFLEPSREWKEAFPFYL